MMRYIEWLVLFVISGLGIALANFVGFDVGFMESFRGSSSFLPSPLQEWRSAK